jgi:hypothetical protein
VVEEMVENAKDATQPPPPAANPAAAPVVELRPPELKPDGGVKQNVDGTVARKRGRPRKEEVAARAVTETPSDAVGLSDSTAPRVPLVLPSVAVPIDPAAAQAAAAMRANVEGSATAASRIAIIVLRRLAKVIAGESVPFEETAEFDERADIEREIKDRMVKHEVQVIPQSAVIVTLAVGYMSKALETPAGKEKIAKLQGWWGKKVAGWQEKRMRRRAAMRG